MAQLIFVTSLVKAGCIAVFLLVRHWRRNRR